MFVIHLLALNLVFEKKNPFETVNLHYVHRNYQHHNVRKVTW